MLSESFFAKEWTQYELNGLTALEMNGGKVILPIWHKASKDEVLAFSPTLVDKLALNTLTSGVAEIAQEIADVLSGVWFQTLKVHIHQFGELFRSNCH